MKINSKMCNLDKDMCDVSSLRGHLVDESPFNTNDLPFGLSLGSIVLTLFKGRICD
jgi:hypothetical protein